MNTKRQILKYVIVDFLSASLVWIIFNNWFHTRFIEGSLYGLNICPVVGIDLIISLLSVSAFWLFIYWFVGFYHDIYRKSRLIEFYKTIISSVFGVIVIFFALILDHTVADNTVYYHSFLFLLILQIVISFIPRNILATKTIKKLRRAEISFPTLLIGSTREAIKFTRNMNVQNGECEYKFTGFVSIFDDLDTNFLEKYKYLGHFDNIKSIIERYKIEEVLVAIEGERNSELRKIISELKNYNIVIKFSPNLYHNLIGETKSVMLSKTAVLQLKTNEFPIWQRNLKLLFDKIASFSFIVLFSPVFLATAIAIRFSSKGSIIYKQKRVGKNEREFDIYKFRSMVEHAEKGLPKLSSSNDSRVTPLGRFMRSIRLDEIPQFFNVLKGDMSIVGPRPERRFYIDKIIKHAPEYRQLLTTKPGITSLGQVKFGYAENIEEMLERLKFDVLYMNNRSLYLDFKILIMTILIIVKGDGK